MQQARSKRDRILDAAQVVFAQKGYYYAKIEEIAELADVGKGTVYEYFASKQELYKEMVKMILADYTRQMEDLFSEDQTVEERIRLLIEMHLNYMIENCRHTPQNFDDSSGLDEELLSWMFDLRRQNNERLGEVFARGIARGELKAIDPELGANLVAGLLKGLTVPIMVDGKFVEPRRVAAEVTDILFHGMAR